MLAALNVERPVVVGHSWGTLVALSLAIHEGLDLRGLVLLSGYYYPGRGPTCADRNRSPCPASATPPAP